MWADVAYLKEFYESSLGKMACSLIQHQLRSLWPSLKKEHLVGLGYPIPYLQGFAEEADTVTVAMPAQQGAIAWPTKNPNLTTLVKELELPFSDLSTDKVLIVHGAEFSEQIRPFLREIWRILKSSGHIILVIPNRRGLWASFEHTPFGRGLPYSAGQISKLLQANMFTPTNVRRVICFPPVKSQLFLSAAPAVEKISSGILSNFAGVIIVEAIKQLYAGQPLGSPQQSRSMLAVPQQSKNSLS